MVDVSYKLRWVWALAMAPLGLVALPILIPVLMIGGWDTTDTVAVSVGTLTGMAAATRVLRSKVWAAPRAAGMDTISNNVLIRHDWGAFREVRVRRVGPLRWDELVFADAHIAPVPPRKRVPEAMQRAMRLRGWDRRMPISMFVRDWRATELGTYVADLQRRTA